MHVLPRLFYFRATPHCDSRFCLRRVSIRVLHLMPLWSFLIVPLIAQVSRVDPPQTQDRAQNQCGQGGKRAGTACIA
jgi:hypothetical protein